MNSKIVASCNVLVGTEPLQFSWLKDGVEMGSNVNGRSKTVTTDSLSVLTIPKVTAEDIGNYTCRVMNQFGTGTYTAPLVLAGQCITSDVRSRLRNTCVLNENFLSIPVS